MRRLVAPIRSNLKGKNNSVKICSFSGIGVDALKAKTVEAVKNNSGETKVVLLVGTNDVAKTSSQILLGKLRSLIRAAKNARTSVSVEICTLPSRKDKGSYVFSRSESVNTQLVRVCKSEGAGYLDVSSVGIVGNELLGRDGVHFSRQGAAAVGHKIAGQINSFLV